MQSKKIFSGVILLAFFVFLSDFSVAQAADQQTAFVSITGSGFVPDNVIIVQGTTVTWTNGDGNGLYSNVHKIVSDSSSSIYSPDLQSNNLALGDTYSYTFTVPGSFGYHSAANSAFEGTVTVSPLVTTTNTPPVTIPAVTVVSPGSEAKTYFVYIRNYSFDPQNITVGKGSTVVWINNDGTYSYAVYHQIESDSSNTLGDFQSDPLGLGGVFSYTFASPGIYGYHCRIHPYMEGTVSVSPDEIVSTTSTTEVVATTTTTTTLPAGMQTVIIDGTDFVPSDLTVPSGTTVTWVNDGPGIHRVVSSDNLNAVWSQFEGEFASDKLNIGEVYSYTFIQPGVYYYMDDLHPSITGRITVQ